MLTEITEDFDGISNDLDIIEDADDICKRPMMLWIQRMFKNAENAERMFLLNLLRWHRIKPYWS